MRRDSPHNSLLLIALLGACGNPSTPDEVDTEAKVDPLTAGTFDCALRTDRGYVDGDSFAIAVATVDGKAVERRTANAFLAMRARAAQDGVSINVVSGFRTNAEQARLYACFVDCDCNNCNPANPPGYSNHQSGAALDLNTEASGVYSWLNAHGSSFGFYRTVSREPWHWEYEGGHPDQSPCADRAVSEAIGITSPPPNAAVNGTVTLRVAASVGTHHVQYLTEGSVFAASEDRPGDFSVRHDFPRPGTYSVTAIAFDRFHRELGRSSQQLRVIDPQPTRLVIRGPADLGWYRNGVDLSVDADPRVARVEWSAGPYLLSSSSSPDNAFAFRAVFQTLGWRVITARGLSSSGVELARASRTLRVVPGDEVRGPRALEFLSPSPGTARIPNGTTLKVAGSDSIVLVEYRAGPYRMGGSSDAAAGFPLRYTFSRTGLRTLEVIGFDGAGAERARAMIDVVIE